MKRKGPKQRAGAVERALEIIGDRWSLLIVRDALEGVCRFNAFQSSLGIARNLLANRLRKLVSYGVLAKRPAGDGTRHFEYMITDKGKQLSSVLSALSDWSAS